MGKATKTRKFAQVKRMLSLKDPRYVMLQHNVPHTVSRTSQRARTTNGRVLLATCVRSIQKTKPEPKKKPKEEEEEVHHAYVLLVSLSLARNAPISMSLMI